MATRAHGNKKQKPKPRPRSRPPLFLSLPAALAQWAVAARWRPEPTAVEELQMDFSLPQLVRCTTPILREAADRGRPLLSLDTPILLMRQHTARYLLARIVVVDKSGAFTESADSVVIPEDYEGRFVRLACRTTKDKSGVRSLQAVASSETAAFVNLSNIVSYPANREPRNLSHMIYTKGNVFLVDEPSPASSEVGQGDDVYAKVNKGGNTYAEVNRGGNAYAKVSTDDNIYAEVSKRGNSYTEVNKGGNSYTEVNKGGNTYVPVPSLSSRGSSHTASGSGVLRCVDERGSAIVIPINQVGEMVEVKKNPSGSTKLSMKAGEIMAGEKFPLVVKFVYGKQPLRVASDTRLFTVLDSFQESSLIGCIVEGGHMTVVEIPLISSLQFQVALNSEELLGQPALDVALEACRARCGEFARDVKFKYRFPHKVQRSTPRMMKLHEDDLPSVTVRTRLIVTEAYVYI